MHLLSIFGSTFHFCIIEDIFTLISKRDVKSYELAIVELNERISRIINESELLNNAISKIESFGTDYNQMTEEQQFELGSYVNLMSASTQLLPYIRYMNIRLINPLICHLRSALFFHNPWFPPPESKHILLQTKDFRNQTIVLYP